MTFRLYLTAAVLLIPPIATGLFMAVLYLCSSRLEAMRDIEEAIHRLRPNWWPRGF